jgi:hypothetical protein
MTLHTLVFAGRLTDIRKNSIILFEEASCGHRLCPPHTMIGPSVKLSHGGDNSLKVQRKGDA